jgi:endoglucanase
MQVPPPIPRSNRINALKRQHVFILAALGLAIGNLLAADPLPARPPWLTSQVQFFVSPDSKAMLQANEWRHSRPADAALMAELAEVPVAAWLDGNANQIAGLVHFRMEACLRQKALPLFVLYNIPERDAGNFAKGGAESTMLYLHWISQVASAIGTNTAVVILEPDALGLMDHYSQAARPERYAMLRVAVTTLTRSGSVDVYIDAGNCAWISANEMSARLRQAGIDQARGFALNVASFQWTKDTLAYGRNLSLLVGGKHFVVDTSRNGRGPLPPEMDPDGLAWCNPPGRAVGPRPSTKTNEPLCDTFLWIKPPGDSDGPHRGGPPAGDWWPEYALELMRNAQPLK